MPGPYTTYPTGPEARSFLIGAGCIEPTQPAAQGIDFDAAASAASRRWEEKTNRKPFLVLPEATPTTRYFDPGGPNRRTGLFGSLGGSRVLEIPGGYISITALLIGYTNTFAGTPLLEGESWWSYPTDAPDNGRPYEWIEFRVPTWGAPRSMSITGRFGFGLLPEDAWTAIRARAAATVLMQIGAALSGGVRSWSEGDVKREYGELPFSGMIDALQGQFDEAVCQYKYVKIGI